MAEYEEIEIRAEDVRLGDLNTYKDYRVVEVTRGVSSVQVKWKFQGYIDTMNVIEQAYPFGNRFRIAREVVVVTKEQLDEMRTSLEGWLHG